MKALIKENDSRYKKENKTIELTETVAQLVKNEILMLEYLTFAILTRIHSIVAL